MSSGGKAWARVGRPMGTGNGDPRFNPAAGQAIVRVGSAPFAVGLDDQKLSPAHPSRVEVLDRENVEPGGQRLTLAGDHVPRIAGAGERRRAGVEVLLRIEHSARALAVGA